MRIRAIELQRSQLGWRVDVTFTVKTARQFTDEEHTCGSGGRYLLTALWNGIRWARHVASQLKAKPGERQAKGWSA